MHTNTQSINKTKFLVIRLSSIGDIVLTTPIVRCIKQQYANAEVHFLVKEQYTSVISANPYINKVITYPNGNINELCTNLQKEQYSYIIDLHHNLRTFKIKSALKGVKSFSFPKLNIQKFLLTSFKINVLPKQHIVDRYFKTVQALGIKNDGKGLDFFIDNKVELHTHDLPTSHAFGFIGIAIGAALNTKQLPVDKLIELCQKINYPIVLLGGKEDTEKGNTIAATDNGKIYNSCGKFSLAETALIVKKANLIITHDTGLMHIAAALQKPILSIWGNTTPAFGMTPYYGEHLVANTCFEVNKLSCRPCSKIGHNSCPKKHFKCMNNQPINTIANTANELVK